MLSKFEYNLLLIATHHADPKQSKGKAISAKEKTITVEVYEYFHYLDLSTASSLFITAEATGLPEVYIELLTRQKQLD